MAEVPPRMRHGRQSGPMDDRPGPSDLDDGPPERERERDHRHAPSHDDFPPENDDERRLARIDEWTALADRRLERLDTKIDRLAVALDQLNSQFNAVLTEMPTRRGINLYLVGGLVGGLAVGLAIMGITIGGFVGGLSSLKPEAAQLAAPNAYQQQPPQPIIIQMPAGAMQGMVPMVSPSLAPSSPSVSVK